MNKLDKIDSIIWGYKTGWYSLEDAGYELLRLDPVRFQYELKNATDFILMNI